MFANSRDEIPPGTLDMRIVKTVSRGDDLHRFEIAEKIQRIPGDILHQRVIQPVYETGV